MSANASRAYSQVDRVGSGQQLRLPGICTLIEVRSSARSDERFKVEPAGGRRVRVPVTFNAEAFRRLLAVIEVTA